MCDTRDKSGEGDGLATLAGDWALRATAGVLEALILVDLGCRDAPPSKLVTLTCDLPRYEYPRWVRLSPSYLLCRLTANNVPRIYRCLAVALSS